MFSGPLPVHWTWPGEIKNQNEGLNEQRDILEEISSLMEDASKTSEELTKSLKGVADLFSKIKAIMK